MKAMERIARMRNQIANIAYELAELAAYKRLNTDATESLKDVSRGLGEVACVMRRIVESAEPRRIGVGDQIALLRLKRAGSVKAKTPARPRVPKKPRQVIGK